MMNNYFPQEESPKLKTERRMVMKFVDDLAGSIYDVTKFIVKSISYLLAGMIIVAVPFYLFVWVFGWFQ